AELAAAGRRPYLIPRGGASGLGAVGYALAAFEVREQLAAHGVNSARVVALVGRYAGNDNVVFWHTGGQLDAVALAAAARSAEVGR
ncbi:MAG: hypothetical protein ACRDPD_24705, partial [Streptosporangiaceae bacterium]